MAFDFPNQTVIVGNATARLYVDHLADERQHKELEDIFQGRKVGPMEMSKTHDEIATYSEYLN